MAILGNLIKKAYQLKDNPIKLRNLSDTKIQRRDLKRLLRKAQFTSFGEFYDFGNILESSDIIRAFQTKLPIADYSIMFKDWWYRSLNGETFVTWPGKVKYFALTSGTSEASSKYIPVTNDMLRSIKKAGIKQLVSSWRFNFPIEYYEKGILMIGGSTHLNYNGTYMEGDLSGISAKNIPFWFQHFYKPGNKISKEKDWSTKLEEIVKMAPKWDIGVIVGVPAWIQIILEKIIERYQLETIHDIWPNLAVYVHSGVSFAPYKKSFDKLFKHPIHYNETYLASEGMIAFQTSNTTGGMRLVLDNGIFYEFVPFNEENFDMEGNILPNAQAVWLEDVKEGEDYAILVSTNAGAWRYLIGDTIRFVSKENAEIIITGRTKHYLSICGEHLSVDNMNRAIELVQQDLDIEIREFAVAGIRHGSLFAHQWFIGSDKPIDTELVRQKIDMYLCELNDDYRVERLEAVKEVFVKYLPIDIFNEWMKINKKEGGAHKFPRVLKNNAYVEWMNFLNEKGY